MARFQWQLVHTFTLPLDSAGQELWRVDFDANYFEDLAKLRKEYSKYVHETRGEISPYQPTTKDLKKWHVFNGN